MKRVRQRGVIWLTPGTTGPETLFLGTLEFPMTMGVSVLRRHRVLVVTEASVFLFGVKVKSYK